MIIHLNKIFNKIIFPKQKKDNIVKNQHYIPESLLRNFTDSNEKIIEVFLKTRKIYPTSPSNSMSEKFVYEHDKLEKNTVEKYFAKIDSKIAPKIKLIIAKIKKLKNGNIDIVDIKSEVEALLPIFIIFYYRSGALLTEFSSINKKDKVPLLSKKILNSYYIDLLSKTIKRGYKFAIIESNDDFLLSDQFISTSALKIKSQFFDISNRHIGLKETLILIPISSSYYIVYWNSEDDFITKDNEIHTLNEEELQLINETIINNSYIKCIGQNKNRIEQVLTKYKMQYPSQIFAGGNPSGYHCGAIRKKEVFFYEEERVAYELLEFMSFMQYKDLGRNDICACGSRKKFKKCHLDAYNRINQVNKTFSEPTTILRRKFSIPNTIIELPVDNWAGFSEKRSVKSEALPAEKDKV